MGVEHHVGVIGSGAWGTSLAILANRAGNRVTLLSRNERVMEAIQTRRVNDTYLPDIFLDPAIEVTDDIQELGGCHTILIVVPSQSVRTLCIALSDLIDADTPIILCSKGIERGSLVFMSEVVESILPTNPLAVLSGPNFAAEAAQGQPTAATLASRDLVLAERLSFLIASRTFRTYINDDIIGVQVGGAVKNVLALATGMAAGHGLGENTRAALVTRGLAEMARLIRIKGGREETLMGLSGIGDIMLSCTSKTSRNYALGFAIGQGTPPAEAMSGQLQRLAEGVYTAESLYELSMKLGISMPISMAVHQILQGTYTVTEAIQELLDRPAGTELSPRAPRVVQPA